MATETGGVCPTDGSGTPILTERWSGTKPRQVVEGFAITTSAVRAVSVDGSPPVSTRREPTLPAGLRAVTVRVRGLPASTGEFPRFVPLNGKGRRLAEGRRAGAPLAVVGIPARSQPDGESPDVCALHAEALAGLKMGVTRGLVASANYDNPVPGAYLACVSTSYSLGGWPLMGGVLLDAAKPGATPSPFPGMKLVRGHPGVFEAESFEGAMVARRIPRAWLVVVNGQGLEQRLSLLDRLRASVIVGVSQSA